MKTLLLISLLLYSLYAQEIDFTSAGIGGGGAIFELSINPNNNEEYYAACDMGQLFHSEDYGLSYHQLHYNQLKASTDTKISFTHDDNLRFGIGQPSNYFSVPIMSTDGGATWTPLLGNPAPDNYTNRFRTKTITADYNNPHRVLISHYDTVYYSRNGGIDFEPILGVATGGNGITVSGSLFDGDTIFLGTSQGVLHSTDGGLNWSIASITGLPADETILSFTAAKEGNTTRFFCLTAAKSDIVVPRDATSNYNSVTGVYTADFGVGNWVETSNEIDVNSDWLLHIDMAQNDISTVYIGAASQYQIPRIFKSSNGGTSWTNVLKVANNENISTGWIGHNGDSNWGGSGRPFGFEVAPNNAERIIFSGWAGIHTTHNGGVNWQQAYVDKSAQHPINTSTPQLAKYSSIGFENTSSWQVSWIDPSNMWVSFTDFIGIKSDDAGKNWSFSPKNSTKGYGNSYRLIQQPSSGTLFLGRSLIHDIYQQTYLSDEKLDAHDLDGKIVYSTDKGANWHLAKQFDHPVYWLEIDPNNEERAYASVVHYDGGSGMGGIYVTENLSDLENAQWTLLSAPPRTEKHPANLTVLNDGKLLAVYSARTIPAANWNHTFTPSSGVFLYNPADKSWKDLSHHNMKYYSKELVVDPNDPEQNSWYVTVQGGGWSPNPAAGLGGLYKTTDRGLNWQRLTTINSESCTFNPLNKDELYVSTSENGLMMSTTINEASPLFDTVDSYNFVHPMRIFFNPHAPKEIWVTSFGGGLQFGYTDGTVPVEQPISMVPYKKILFKQLGNSIQFNNTQNFRTLSLYSLNGRQIFEQSIASKKGVSIRLNNISQGTYIVRLHGTVDYVQKIRLH